ncbi:cI repressor protein [Lysobacteraceae bacterium NML75-0749]|nr:cI repressor protein [Xanthomonadaceae bacterium NML75-0749]
MTLGQRIIEARKARNLSRRQLSELSGVGYPTLAGIENDAQKSSTQLPDLAQALQVNIGWLHTGKGTRDYVPDPDQWAEVTRWKQPLAAGDGSIPEDYAETGGLKFKRTSLQRKGLRPDKLAVLYASGDSMSPRIQDGDALLLDLSDTQPADDHIYALQYDGQLYVKRLRRFGQQWFLVSDNHQDPKWRDPQPVDTRHDFQIIGRVRWIGSWED